VGEIQKMKLFASKFQSKEKLDRFQRIIEECDQLRKELWEKKPAEMEAFKAEMKKRG
jgi:hypothetical protein